MKNEYVTEIVIKIRERGNKLTGSKNAETIESRKNKIESVCANGKLIFFLAIGLPDFLFNLSMFMSDMSLTIKVNEVIEKIKNKKGKRVVSKENESKKFAITMAKIMKI